MSTKEDFHKLIDSIESEEKVNSYYELISSLVTSGGEMWSSLSERDKQETLKSLEESKEDYNLLSNEEVKAAVKPFINAYSEQKPKVGLVGGKRFRN